MLDDNEKKLGIAPEFNRFMIIFFAVGSVFQLVNASFGYQTERMISSVVNVVLNIIVSVIALMLLSDEYKIAGLGIGSAVGAFGQMLSAYCTAKETMTVFASILGKAIGVTGIWLAMGSSLKTVFPRVSL